MEEKRIKRVLVAMSGGVDSSAAAVLLQQHGYTCDGAMLRLCGGEQAEDAQSVADKLGMRLHILDGRERFRREVMEHFTAEYCAGRTPNPCIDCNRCLKFGMLMDWALAQGYDYLATGHYARVGYDGEHYLLLRGRDQWKDQSYVLYQLTQRQLAHLLLPVGEYDKPAIRRRAQDAGLVNADRPDSQDICFIPDGDYVGFLQRSGVTLKPGSFVDENGTVLGQHRGLPCYTTGQSKGLGISMGRRMYVLGKNAEENTVVLGDNEKLFRRELTACRVNWIVPRAEPFRCTAKTRYSQTEAACTVYPEGECLYLMFDEPQRAITAGQAVVLYDGEIVLGGGTIC